MRQDVEELVGARHVERFVCPTFDWRRWQLSDADDRRLVSVPYHAAVHGVFRDKKSALDAGSERTGTCRGGTVYDRELNAAQSILADVLRIISLNEYRKVAGN